ncbi:hypothetical protein GHT06_014595 [Daphnia sinensis]|uniref:Uncharacterized protein n=1 Tax=Daphnia sinensis TaxID=1820382 RepID=A0AAD5L806_9CRUS|nr:hypothetical protein GHT06_005467 [Daphnia sinensis]KAI9550620.1 hypothetical protein GHT06_005426 [Daphnia sinensis]KAI9557845.1 hypothetical protein GHT06_014595 [Daphnia sinensis]
MSQSTSTGSNYTCKLYFDPRADEPDTGGHWITDKELYKKLLNLMDMEEEIQHAYLYSNPLSSWQATNAMFYHAFIVMKTNAWWWSIEKNMERITIQRSRDIESVRDMYQRKKRTTGSTSLTSIKENKITVGGKTTIGELINYIWRKDCLNDVYHFLDANCQKFAALVFNRIELSWDDQVYFDEAADQPRSSTSSCYMTVDTFLCKVQRLSASETLSHVELYTAARLKCVILVAIFMSMCVIIHLPFLLHLMEKIIFQSETFQIFFFCVSFLAGYVICSYVVLCSYLEHIGLLSRHSFVIFKTNMETYWSFERFPTHYVIHRAGNKDILLKECKRASQHFLIFKPKLHKKALAVEWGIIAILELIWKKDNLNSERNLPIEDCGQIASIIYENIKRPN